MIVKNSSKSISPPPSSSTFLIKSLIESRFDAKSSAMKGSSNSSTPMAPEPSASKSSKISLSFFLSWRLKSFFSFPRLQNGCLPMYFSFPRFFNQFRTAAFDSLFLLGRIWGVYGFEDLFVVYFFLSLLL